MGNCTGQGRHLTDYVSGYGVAGGYGSQTCGGGQNGSSNETV